MGILLKSSRGEKANSMNRIDSQETILSRPWPDRIPPKKLLAIRLQALGDIVITLPYLQALRSILPATEFHFVTREEFADLPHNLKMFDKVYGVEGGFDIRRQFMSAAFLIPRLQKERYEVVIDLQRNLLTRTIRRFLFPKSFSEFDRFSLNSAGDRTLATINKIGFTPLPEMLARLDLRENDRGLDKLKRAGYDPGKKLIVLNPAGNFITKSWPIESYRRFADGWISTVDSNVQFLMLGMESLREKSKYLEDNLGKIVINLVGKTTISEAFSILRQAELVISEDSGLMHMAWVAQVPVVALFGSSRSSWSKPLGKSVCLDSSDLECGECLQPTCRFGDVHCLARYSPEFVIETARKLLAKRVE
jgi:ADP-heptose:LPS heptosyltransferase